MKIDKKIALLVLGLAVVSSGATLWIRSEIGNHLNFSDKMVMYDDVVEPMIDFGKAESLVGSADFNTIEPDMVSRGAIGMPPYYPNGDDALNVDDRVYEMYSSHDVVVDDVGAYARGIKEYILSINGRILSSDISSNRRYKTAQISAKVPADKFDEANSRITDGVKEIVNENVNAQDVTGRHVRIAEDLAKLEEQKAEKQIDLLEAPTEVARRRINLEIKRIESRIAALTKTKEGAEEQVEYATINVGVSDSIRYFNPRAELPLLEVLKEAIRSLGGVGYMVGYLAIWALVYAIVWLPIVLVGRAIIRAFFKKLRK